MTKSQLKRARAPEHKTERRAVILRAAEALLRRDPAATFAVEEIARRAGLAKGTVYLYFGSREEMLIAVHDAQMDELLALARAGIAQLVAHQKRALNLA